MDEFYCKAYFHLEYLKFFYNNKPKEIMDFYEKIKKKIDDKMFKSIDDIGGYIELRHKFRIIGKFKDKVFDIIDTLKHFIINFLFYFLVKIHNFLRLIIIKELKIFQMKISFTIKFIHFAPSPLRFFCLSKITSSLFFFSFFSLFFMILNHFNKVLV